MATVPARVPEGRGLDLSRGLRLEYLTLFWNVIEAGVGFVAGALAGSPALIGFALDSVAEGASATVLAWRFKAEISGRESAEDSDRRAVRGVAVAFFLLAAYIGGRAVFDLARGHRPGQSLVGILLAVGSLVVMPWLALRKRRLARELHSRALAADSVQTEVCAYLSAFLLVGLAANAWLGWWWADPAAALAIAGFAIKEGAELWRTEEICC